MNTIVNEMLQITRKLWLGDKFLPESQSNRKTLLNTRPGFTYHVPISLLSRAVECTDTKTQVNFITTVRAA
jgi:hypothetical protein